MHITNSAIRNNKKSLVQDRRIIFVLNDDLFHQIRECADTNHISISHFLRESARRNIKRYEREELV